MSLSSISSVKKIQIPFKMPLWPSVRISREFARNMTLKLPVFKTTLFIQDKSSSVFNR
jgi:hypothetical protein